MKDSKSFFGAWHFSLLSNLSISWHKISLLCITLFCGLTI